MAQRRHLDTGFEVAADGLLLPEGPVWLPDGDLVVVEVGGGRVSRIGPAGETLVIAEPGGGPNGAALGPDGALYICNNGGGFACAMAGGRLSLRPDLSLYVGGSIQRIDLSMGEVTTLFTHGAAGERLIAPNDLVFDGEGGLWFTDHGRAWGNPPLAGGLYHVRIDRSEPPVRLRAGLRSPNGIGLSPDGALLYWADTMEASLWCADIAAPGRLAPRSDRRIGALDAGRMLDSLAVQADGRVCVATIGDGGITRFGGGAPEHFALPDAIVTNICFGGDGRDAYVTAAETGRVLKLRWTDKGAGLAFGPAFREDGA